MVILLINSGLIKLDKESDGFVIIPIYLYITQESFQNCSRITKNCSKITKNCRKWHKNNMVLPLQWSTAKWHTCLKIILFILILSDSHWFWESRSFSHSVKATGVTQLSLQTAMKTKVEKKILNNYLLPVDIRHHIGYASYICQPSATTKTYYNTMVQVTCISHL